MPYSGSECTSRRPITTDHRLNDKRIGFQSRYEHFLSDSSPKFHAPAYCAAVKPTMKSSPNAISEIGNEFRHMSRTELENFTHSKMVEANEYKHHFNELEKKCILLQSSVDEMKKLYAETYIKPESAEREDGVYRIENIASAGPR